MSNLFEIHLVRRHSFPSFAFLIGSDYLILSACVPLLILLLLSARRDVKLSWRRRMSRHEDANNFRREAEVSTLGLRRCRRRHRRQRINPGGGGGGGVDWFKRRSTIETRGAEADVASKRLIGAKTRLDEDSPAWASRRPALGR